MITKITKDNIALFQQIYQLRTSAKLNTTSIENPNLHLYVVHDEEVYGWMSIVFMPKVGYREGIYYLDELYVHPSYENKGYASELLEYMQKTFQNKDIRLYVSDDNANAIHLYKKHQFTVLATALFMGKDR